MRSPSAVAAKQSCTLVIMLLNLPAAAHCHPHSSNRQHPGPTRGCGRLSTAQVIEQEVAPHSADQTDQLTRSHSEPGQKTSDMGSKPQIPRNKVLTTSMIAHATNKEVDQVRQICGGC